MDNILSCYVLFGVEKHLEREHEKCILLTMDEKELGSICKAFGVRKESVPCESVRNIQSGEYTSTLCTYHVKYFFLRRYFIRS